MSAAGGKDDPVFYFYLSHFPRLKKLCKLWHVKISFRYNKFAKKQGVNPCGLSDTGVQNRLLNDSTD
jgi:hypothetical protein